MIPPPSRRASQDTVRVVACPDGPLLVRGDLRVVSQDGTPLQRSRRTVALCRCGFSGIAPWCDGTHKIVGFTDGSRPADPQEQP